MLRNGLTRIRPVAAALSRAYGTASGKAASLPDLPYDYAALEPVISARIMQLHHGKHHQAYVTNLNTLLSKAHDAEAKGDHAALEALQPGLRFNGGGHLNHTSFWNTLAPKNAAGGVIPSSGSKLGAAITAEFGSFDNMIAKFNATTTGVMGSGWGWLVYNPVHDRLLITTTPNQDRPEDLHPVVSLLGIDVWEHAYYLDYENRRADYLKNIWQIVNWGVVEQRFAAATSKP